MRRSPVFCIPVAQPERQASSLVRRSRRSCSVPATLIALWEVVGVMGGAGVAGGHLRQSRARCNTNTSGPLRRTCTGWSTTFHFSFFFWVPFDCNLCCRAESLTVRERDGLLVQIKPSPPSSTSRLKCGQADVASVHFLIASRASILKR